MKIIVGTSVCKGIAIGKAFLFHKVHIDIPDYPANDRQLEWQSVTDAISQADKRLEAYYNIALETIGDEEAEIFDVHRMMLSDDDFLDAICEKIKDSGKNAIRAVSETRDDFVAYFEALEDEYMRARAADIKDISELLMQILAKVPEGEKLNSPAVIFADDLTPSDTVKLERKNILAFVTRKGSMNSHTAILSRTMGIPSIVQADFDDSDITTGITAAVDGNSGTCYLMPDEATVIRLERAHGEELVYKQECEAMRGLPSVTQSGKTIEVFANIGSSADIESVLENDAEGIGLFRSEFLYLGRNSLPTEEEQFKAYRHVAEKMAGKKVIIRTMDIGADKQVDYLGLDVEENPALGYRAIRICLDRPELFQAQLRAICRASAYGNIAIMFPMIASKWEIVECKNALKQAQDALKAEGIPFGDMEVGIMIETPASVILRDEFAKEVDFFSVGTNDLTQYTLAADRQNQKLERYADPHHSAVIEMLRQIAESANKNGIWAGICGELAGDIELVDKFIDMGYKELSVVPPLVLPLRKAIRELEL